MLVFLTLIIVSLIAAHRHHEVKLEKIFNAFIISVFATGFLSAFLILLQDFLEKMFGILEYSTILLAAGVITGYLIIRLAEK